MITYIMEIKFNPEEIVDNAIEERYNKLQKEEEERVSYVLEKIEEHTKRLEEYKLWLKLYKEGKKPVLDGDIFRSSDVNKLM